MGAVAHASAWWVNPIAITPRVDVHNSNREQGARPSKRPALEWDFSEYIRFWTVKLCGFRLGYEARPEHGANDTSEGDEEKIDQYEFDYVGHFGTFRFRLMVAAFCSQTTTSGRRYLRTRSDKTEWGNRESGNALGI